METGEGAVPGAACVGGSSSGTASSRKRQAASSKRNQQGIYKKIKPIAAYFGTSPITESQVVVHEPEESNQGSHDNITGNIIQTVVHEPEESNQGSHDNILQASIQGFSRADIEPKLVETKEHLQFPLVYRLIKLALTLPVATASVERVFSAMNIIKTDLRNKISDDWLNDMMVCYVERDIFAGIDDKKIIEHFHGLRDRRGHLPNPPRILTT